MFLAAAVGSMVKSLDFVDRVVRHYVYLRMATRKSNWNSL